MKIPSWLVAGFSLSGAIFLAGSVAYAPNIYHVIVDLFFIIASCISFTYHLVDAIRDSGDSKK